MAGAARKFSAVIEVGATVGKSVSQVGRAVSGDLAGVRASMRDLKVQQDKLEQYDPRAVIAARREYRALRRESAKLEKAFNAAEKPTAAMRKEMLAAKRAADKAGKAYESQRAHLDKLGGELTQAGVNTDNLVLEQKRLAQSSERLQKRLAALERVSGAGLPGALSKVGSEARQLATGIGLSVGAVGAALTMTNAATAQNESLARALGVSSAAFDAWGGLAREAGFEAENVGDLIEEMSNKLGESKGLEEITPVTESLQILGLAFQDLENLSPEEQFRTIAKAIKDLDDQQAAVSAADILMGGEANKFFGYLRSRKEGVDELLGQQRALNSLTDEGRQGAHAYNTAVSRLTTAVGSAAKEVAGVIGGVLGPYVEDIAPKISAWVNAHREDLKGFAEGLGKALPKVGAFVSGLFGVVSAVGSAVDSIANMLGGWENMAYVVGALVSSKLVVSFFSLGRSLWTVGSALAPLVSSALPALAAGVKAVGLAVMANPIGAAIGLAVMAVYRLITAWDELKAAFSVGGAWGAVKTFFGFGGEQNAAAQNKSTAGNGQAAPAAPVLPPPAGSVRSEVRNTYDIRVTAAPGQSAEEVADAVIRKMDARQHDANRTALYDGAY